MDNKFKFIDNMVPFEDYYGKAGESVPMWEVEDEIDFQLGNNLYGKCDAVNSPAHYTRGSQEAIDIIEEAIQDAPDVKCGMLQAQALKYLLRLWLKDNPKQDAEKARWYLNRLIDSL